MLCSLCVLKDGTFVHGELVMFCMCIDRGCVGIGESKLCSLCVFSDGTFLHGV